MAYVKGRAPHGARGLKRRADQRTDEEARSRPARGAWIETLPEARARIMSASRPARGAWIETCYVAPLPE